MNTQSSQSVAALAARVLAIAITRCLLHRPHYSPPTLRHSSCSLALSLVSTSLVVALVS